MICQNIRNVSLLFFLILFISIFRIQAQVGISSDSFNPNASAMLDVKSTDKGILIPRMTNAERDAITTPATGLLVFVTTDSSFYFYNGTAWTIISTTSTIADADNDTKIQVEESTDEDIIRFDIGGSEKWIMRGSRLESKNSGNSIFIGGSAGRFDDLTDNRNTFVGSNAGYFNTSGSRNTFIGQDAGRSATTGSRNVNFGYEAGELNTTGSYNVCIGTAAGYNNLTGENNVFLGYNAGFYETGSNKLYIDNLSVTTPLIYGEFDNNLLRVNGTLNINNAFSFPTVDGSTGQILVTNGSGILSWNADSDAQDLSLSSNTLSLTNGGSVDLTAFSNTVKDADNDTKIQVEESADDDIIRFDIGGSEIWRMVENRIETKNTGNSIFIGINAGTNDNLNNNKNLFIGNFTGSSNVSGLNNLFIGDTAGTLNTSGGNNCFFGIQAGRKSSTGDRNVYLGNYAGELNEIGENNIFLGFEAGLNEMGSNKLYIENSDSVDPLIYGEFDNNLLRINGTLNINNTFSFPLIDGVSGQTMITDGNGNLSWENNSDAQNINLNNNILSLTNGGSVDLSGYLDNTDAQSLSLNSNILSLTNGGSVDLTAFSNAVKDADNDTKIQVEESVDEDIIRFDIGGAEKWKMIENRIEPVNTGNSVFIGVDAGINDDLSLNQNTFIGDKTGFSNTSGKTNSFYGANSGEFNTDGSQNTFLGNQAGRFNTTGYINVCVGAGAGNNNMTGWGNVFLGYHAGYFETGSNKLVISNGAINPLIYGEFDNNIVGINGKLGVGTTTPASMLTVSGGATIGTNFSNISSPTNGMLVQGSVGIGTSAPSAKLHVYDAGQAIQTIESGNDGNTQLNLANSDGQWSISGPRTNTQDLVFYWKPSTTNTFFQKFLIESSGDATLSGDLTVEGKLTATGLSFGNYENVQWDQATGEFYYDNSSRRYKENITNLEDDFFKILEVQPVRYTRPGKPDRWETGYIAEEFDSLGLKWLTNYDEEGLPASLNYERVCLYVVEVVKTHQQEIQALKMENKQLRIQIEKINQLEMMVLELKAKAF